MIVFVALAAVLTVGTAIPETSTTLESSAAPIPTFKRSPPFAETVNDVNRRFVFPANTESRARGPTFERMTEVPAPDSRHRQLAVFPSLDGLQVGLDFRLPFLNIPYSSLLSGIFSSGATLAHTGNFFKLNLTSLAIVAAIAIVTIIYYPQVLNLLGVIPKKETFRALNDFTSHDILFNIKRSLDFYNIDANSCLKMAVCSAGKDNRGRKQNRGMSFTMLDILDGILSVTGFEEILAKQGIREARAFGETGGDCNVYNKEGRCPLNADLWRFVLSRLNYAF